MNMGDLVQVSIRSLSQNPFATNSLTLKIEKISTVNLNISNKLVPQLSEIENSGGSPPSVRINYMPPF